MITPAVLLWLSLTSLKMIQLAGDAGDSDDGALRLVGDLRHLRIKLLIIIQIRFLAAASSRGAAGFLLRRGGFALCLAAHNDHFILFFI